MEFEASSGPAKREMIDPSMLGVLDIALDAVVVMREDGTIAAANNVAEDTFGWRIEDVYGRSLGDVIIPPGLRKAHADGMERYMRTGQGPILDRRVEVTAVRSDGGEFPVELAVTTAQHDGERLFIGFIRDITYRKEAERRQALMMAELNHRVKNMLAVVDGIAHQTARTCGTVDAFIEGFGGRIQALARAHDILTSKGWESAGLRALAETLLGPYGKPEGRITIEGPEVLLTSRQTLSVSMLLHELISNALKYGALKVQDGTIILKWELGLAEGSEIVVVRWKESGLDGVGVPTKSGFGTKMMALSAKHELKGDLQADWQFDGLSLAFQFPRDERQDR